MMMFDYYFEQGLERCSGYPLAIAEYNCGVFKLANKKTSRGLFKPKQQYLIKLYDVFDFCNPEPFYLIDPNGDTVKCHLLVRLRLKTSLIQSNDPLAKFLLKLFKLCKAKEDKLRSMTEKSLVVPNLLPFIENDQVDIKQQLLSQYYSNDSDPDELVKCFVDVANLVFLKIAKGYINSHLHMEVIQTLDWIHNDYGQIELKDKHDHLQHPFFELDSIHVWSVQ